MSRYVSLVAGVMLFGLSSCFSPETPSDDVSTLADSETSATQTAPNPSTSEAIELQFGLYTAEKPTALVEQFRPVLDALEVSLTDSMGQPVEIDLQVASTYEKGVENLVQGEVDFAQLGPASYVEAKASNPEISILAVENQGGTKVFYGIICVSQDSSVQNIGDLAGKSFAFGDERSTIGRFLSQEYLLTNGIKASDLSRYEYLGRHDRVGAAVGLGEFDAGALKERAFKKLVEQGTPIREIARFPNVTRPWVASSELPDEIETQLRRALLELDDPAALDAVGKDGFFEASDADYAPTRTAIENNDAFFR